MPKQFFVGAKGVLKTQQGYLLFKRQVKPGIFVWEAIGGRLEEGESFKQTLDREILEETCLHAEQYEVGDQLGFELIPREPQEGVGLVLVYFLILVHERVSSIKISSEHTEIKVVSRASQLPDNIDKGLGEILKRLLNHGQ